MDSLTQLVLGSAMGELTLAKKLGWRGLAWGGFFGTLPDLDILASPYFDVIERLYWHRGLSHSILAIIIATFLFGYLLHKLHFKRELSFKRAATFVFLAWSTHVLIDCFTTYGTQIYEPFSNVRVSFNNMAIIDFFFTTPLMIGCVLAVVFRKNLNLRFKMMSCCVLCSCLYACLSFVFKFRATEILNQRIAQHAPEAKLVSTAPTLTNIILWRGLYETESNYLISYWSIFDKKEADIIEIPRNTSAVDTFFKTREFQGLQWFSRDVWVVRSLDEKAIEFSDMRFTDAILTINNQKTIKPIFSWVLQKTEEGIKIQQQMGMRSGLKQYVLSLKQRALGDVDSWNVDVIY